MDKLFLEKSLCSDCAACVAFCPYDALALRTDGLELIHEECVLCDLCVIGCPTGALSIRDEDDVTVAAEPAATTP